MTWYDRAPCSQLVEQRFVGAVVNCSVDIESRVRPRSVAICVSSNLW